MPTAKSDTRSPSKLSGVIFACSRDCAAALLGTAAGQGARHRRIWRAGPSVSLRRKQAAADRSTSAPASPLTREINAVLTSGTLEPRAALAAMQYNELLARRIVAEVARSSVDGGALQPVMLHEVARRLKINEASVEDAMYRAVAERWLIVEGSSLYRIRLTAAGQALLSPR